jgi:diguanylate cyclase (GGDEF)-like protein
MAKPGTPILIVSDSPQRSVVMEQLLLKAGFTSVNSCKGTVSALQYLEHHPIQVLLAEWNSRDVDGLEMAVNLRDIQRDQFRFTYTMLIVTEEIHDDFDVALEESVDSIILMKDLRRQIQAKVKAGARIANQLNELLSTNRLLMEECNQLQMGQMLDPLTGLGNIRQARQGLQDTIRQIDSRGGAACFVLVKVCNYKAIVERYDQKIANELIVAVSERVQQLVRPLDIVTYFDTALFAVVLLQPRVEDCTVESYQRIYDGIRLKSYTTSIGFLSASIAMSICASGAETGPPKSSVLISSAQENLGLAESTGEIQVTQLLP